MTLAALDTLIAAGRALNAALDGDDAAAIERRTTDYAAAVTAVRATGSWYATPDLRVRVAEAQALAQAARTRVKVASDTTRRRLALLTAAAGREAGVGYRRDGRLR